KQRRADPLRAHLVAGRHGLLDRRIDRVRLDQRAAGRIDELRAVEVPDAQLEDIAAATAHRDVVAGHAGRVVVHGAEAVLDGELLAEDLGRGVHVGLRREAVAEAVVAGGRLGDRVDVDAGALRRQRWCGRQFGPVVGTLYVRGTSGDEQRG